MTTAQSQLDFSGNVRRTDPNTSKEAAMMSGEKRAAHAKTIIAYVRACPGQCSAEIAHAVKIERHEVSRRLGDMEGAGLIRKGRQRRSAIGLTNQHEWYAVEGGVA